jgi:prophage DNA circulation protein
MASTSEVGHAKNVANFQDLIAFVNGYGATYNPSKNSLKLPQLQTLHTEAKNTLTEVTAKTTAFNKATNTRLEAFKNLCSLSTRLLNALDATDASQETIKDAKAINRKMQGKRASKIETPHGPNRHNPRTTQSRWP